MGGEGVNDICLFWLKVVPFAGWTSTPTFRSQAWPMGVRIDMSRRWKPGLPTNKNKRTRDKNSEKGVSKPVELMNSQA